MGPVPEGDTIHRLARDQRRDLVGRPVAVSSPQGRFADGAASIDGRVVDRIEAHGKHLFQHLDGLIVHVHLGLIGRFRAQPSPPEDPVGEVRLREEGPDRTWDLSGPQACRLITPDERDEIVDGLGPDPLRRAVDADRVWEGIHRSDRAIGVLLLDQSVVAGIGNVYRAELLFLCGIDPRRPGSSLSRGEVDGLWLAARDLLRRGVRLGRIVTRDPDEVSLPVGRLGEDERLYVYQRSTCRRCGAALSRFPLGGRTIWACPVCQR